MSRSYGQGPYCQGAIEERERKAHQHFYGKENTNNNKRPSRRCCRYIDVELKPDERLKQQRPVSKSVKIPNPNEKPRMYPRNNLLEEDKPCHYGGKPKKIKTKKAKKSKKVRKTNKSRKSTNFLFNLFK